MNSFVSQIDLKLLGLIIRKKIYIVMLHNIILYNIVTLIEYYNTTITNGF